MLCISPWNNSNRIATLLEDLHLATLLVSIATLLEDLQIVVKPTLLRDLDHCYNGQRVTMKWSNFDATELLIIDLYFELYLILPNQIYPFSSSNTFFWSLDSLPLSIYQIFNDCTLHILLTTWPSTYIIHIVRSARIQLRVTNIYFMIRLESIDKLIKLDMPK